MQFKILFKRQGQKIELDCTLILRDRYKEQFRCKNNYYDFIIQSNRPRLRNHPGLKKWTPTWQAVSGSPSGYEFLVLDAGREIVKMIEK